MTIASNLSIHDLQKINFELEKKKLNLNRIGTLTNEGKWNRYVNGCLGRSQPRLLALIEKVNQTFADLEQKGVKIFDPTIIDQAYLEKKHRYQATRKIYLNVAEGIAQHLNQMQNVCPDLKQAYHELQCREVGLRYSLGKSNGGLDALDQPDKESFEKIQELAKKWKKKQKLAVDVDLNELEKEQLKELAKYPEWLKVVVKDPAYLSEVFGWSLRDFNQVGILVKCFETRRKLKVALLSANLGYVRNLHLTKPEDEVIAFRTVATKVDNVKKRILTASIYHGSFNTFEPAKQERINILKPTESIHFKQGNYHLTVEEFLQEMGEKNARESNVNLCGDWGFVNFHPVLGPWNAKLHQYEMPNLSVKDWTDHVPPSRIASHAELIEQYGEKKIKGRQFFFKVMSTRQTLNLKALDSHSYWQLYLRMKDGNWKVINFGLYAYRFQRGILDGLSLFCASVRRVVCLMDQNGYYTQRQRAAYAVFPNDEKQEKVLENLQELLLSRGVFQFAGRNCTYPFQKILSKLFEDLPNFFKLPISRTKTGIGPLDRLLAWSHRSFEWVRWLVVHMLHSLFMSHRTFTIKKEKRPVTYSVQEYLKKHGHNICNPSYLHKQIEEAKKTGKEPFVNGELYWSNSEEKMYQLKANLKS